MNLIDMKNITKTFGETIALDNVDFYLGKGEILSLLGENGAGKTTLMKVLFGMHVPDSGKIFIEGVETTIKNPIDAINKGICMVHQHFMLVPAFTVTENIIVGKEPHSGVYVDKEIANKQIVDLMNQFNLKLDPNKKCSELSVGELQRVEILKALYREAEVLILDEPTAILTPQEVMDLFIILDNLRKGGKSIIIITHKLRETMSIADRIAVLRDGKIIKNDIIKTETTIEELSEMMVGREVELWSTRYATEFGDTCLSLKNLNVSENGKKILNNINIDIRRGEIVGIAGIEGNGQTPLLECLTGLKEPDSMDLIVNGKEIKGNANDFLRNLIAHVPEDRNTMGLVGQMSIKENSILGYHAESKVCKKGLLNESEITSYAEKCKDEYSIKAPSINALVSSLSGGNQQKVIIARAFSHDPCALIVAQPTRGVDIGSSEYIHKRLLDIRDEGKAVLLVSADLDEVRKLSDRILVLYDGEIVSESLPGELNEIELGLFMAGSSPKSKLEDKK